MAWSANHFFRKPLKAFVLETFLGRSAGPRIVNIVVNLVDKSSVSASRHGGGGVDGVAAARRLQTGAGSLKVIVSLEKGSETVPFWE